MSEHKPPTDAQTPDSRDSQPEHKIVVSDPEDFAKTRQIRSIFDARDAYVDERRAANRAVEDGEISFSTKNSRIYRHLQDFAMSVEPLKRQYDTDIWTGKTYHLDGWATPVDVPTFEDAKAHCQQHNQQLLDALEKTRNGNGELLGMGYISRSQKIKNRIIWEATETGVEFNGIEEILSETPRLCFLQADKKSIGRSAPPQKLSDEVFRDLQGFVDDIGLGFDVRNEQQTKIDESLLKEVDQWRRTNL